MTYVTTRCQLAEIGRKVKKHQVKALVISFNLMYVSYPWQLIFFKKHPIDL